MWDRMGAKRQCPLMNECSSKRVKHLNKNDFKKNLRVNKQERRLLLGPEFCSWNSRNMWEEMTLLSVNLEMLDLEMIMEVSV